MEIKYNNNENTYKPCKHYTGEYYSGKDRFSKPILLVEIYIDTMFICYALVVIGNGKTIYASKTLNEIDERYPDHILLKTKLVVE